MGKTEKAGDYYYGKNGKGQDYGKAFKLCLKAADEKREGHSRQSTLKTLNWQGN
jgi:hypothetical protein